MQPCGFKRNIRSSPGGAPSFNPERISRRIADRIFSKNHGIHFRNPPFDDDYAISTVSVSGFPGGMSPLRGFDDSGAMTFDGLHPSLTDVVPSGLVGVCYSK